MAKSAKAVPEISEAATPRKGKKLLIIIVAAVLLLVVVGGGAAFFLMKKGEDHGDDEDAVESTPVKKKKKEGKEGHPVFLNLDPFTVNLVPETGDQYLQVTVSVELEEPAAEQAVKAHMPKIRNNVTLLLSGKKASELLSKEGKQKLAAELKDAMNEVLEPPRKNKGGPIDGPTKEVLFTSFIIQ